VSVYLIATIELDPAGFDRFKGAMAQMVGILEATGWKLASAFSVRIGQLGTVIDIWELPDAGHLDIGLGAVARHPRFPAIQAVLRETIRKETLVLADSLVYPPPQD
jgi:hypothetical protein